MINWGVRLKNKQFYISIIPALALLAQAIAKAFGVEIDLAQEQANILEIVNTAFVVLTILGVVVDPTTAGVGDSGQALGYETPREG